MEKENVTEELVEETPNAKATRELVEVVHEYGEVLEKRQEILDDMEATIVKVKTDQDAIAEDIAKREQELFQKEVSMTLKEHDLQAFAEVINVINSEQLEDVVNKLKVIVGEIKLSAGYIPKENAKQAEYDVYAQKKDTKGMIGSKLSQLFFK